MKPLYNENNKEEVRQKLVKAKKYGWVSLIIVLVSFYWLFRLADRGIKWLDFFAGLSFILSLTIYEHQIGHIAFFKGYDEGYKAGTTKDSYWPMETDSTDWWREEL